MRIAVECKSPLLQKSLEIFLAKHLTSPKHSDITIRDVECLNDVKCFYISSDSQKADLRKPFSKSQLILALEHRYKSFNKDLHNEYLDETSEESLNFDILEKRIDQLTQEYKQNILRAVQAFYEK